MREPVSIEHMGRGRFFASLRMAIMMVLLTACSVKEDRGDCPCWLSVRGSGPDCKVSAWLGTRLLFEDLDGTQTDLQVPRGIVDVLVSHGDFLVPEGRQMNELFASLTPVDTQCEVSEVTPPLNKQFARINLEFVGSENGRMEGRLEVIGNVKGADRRTLVPVAGAFRCTPDESSDMGYEVRVPRQKDDSLMLLRYSQYGEVLSPIPLGQIIREVGYDWTQDSLSDIIIRADTSASTFRITVMKWDGPVIINVTI